MKTEIIGIDDFPVVDLSISLCRLPETNGAVEARGQSWQGGGKVATALCAAGRLGASAGIIGIVGDDSPGRFCKADFERHGVDTGHLILQQDATTTLSIAMAESQTGGRSFIGIYGTTRRLQIEDLDKGYIQSAKYLHLWQMTPACVQAAQWAREAGVTVAFDGDVYETQTLRHLHLIDVLIASEFFARDMLGRDDPKAACEAMRAAGPRIAVVTLGEKGCVGIDETGFFEQPAFTGLPLEDTTGAGDVFHGAFLYCLSQGLSARECARVSSAVSAIKCTRRGGRAAIPTRKMVDALLRGESLDYGEIEERVRHYARCRFGEE